jgi:hypothetical protein
VRTCFIQDKVAPRFLGCWGIPRLIVIVFIFLLLFFLLNTHIMRKDKKITTNALGFLNSAMI